MIIGVTGLARHGKDTVGQYLAGKYDFARFAFADTLKSMAYTLDPIVASDKLGGVRLREYVDHVGWDDAKSVPEVRRFLQVLGTEAVRDHLGDNSWVEALAVQIGRYGWEKNTVITDVRFPNEVDAVESWGGIMVRVVRPNFDNGLPALHPSEAFVSTLPVNFELVNDGTLNELHARITAMMADIQEGFVRA